uniref:Uncharacterized protein n=1 Tax=Rhizophora mucronata TaxID=61149 RepID=A0A2P2P9B7_RHIMU
MFVKVRFDIVFQALKSKHKFPSLEAVYLLWEAMSLLVF